MVGAADLEMLVTHDARRSPCFGCPYQPQSTVRRRGRVCVGLVGLEERLGSFRGGGKQPLTTYLDTLLEMVLIGPRGSPS